MWDRTHDENAPPARKTGEPESLQFANHKKLRMPSYAYSRNRAVSASTNKRMRRSSVSKFKKLSLSKPVKSTFGKQPFPKQLFNTVRYCETVNLSLGGTGQGYYLYSCNGLYDPNVSGTGHQPMYFDQLMAVYDHYTVLKSRLKLTVVGTGNYPVITSLGQDDDTTLNVASAYETWERPTYRTKVVNTFVEQDKPSWSFWDAKKVFGGDPQAQDSLQGNSGANPSEQTYFVVYMDGGITGASGTVTILVEIDYSVVWDELKSMAGS